jgi:CheY-like chemotaxis protein
VDDQELLARLSCELLEMRGYRADYAYSGHEALAKFGNDHFDLVVTDYRMDGIDGIELARRLRRLAPAMPIIIVSGYEMPLAGNVFSAWVEKQDGFPVLVETIERLLNESPQERDASHPHPASHTAGAHRTPRQAGR